MIEPKTYWLIIPPQIAFDENLNNTTKMLAGRIFGLVAQKGYCYASNEYLSEGINTTTRTVRRCLEILKDKGYFKVQVIRDKNGEVKERRIYPKFDTHIETTPQDKNVPTPRTKSSTGQDENVHIVVKVSNKDLDNTTPPKKTNGISKKYSSIKDIKEPDMIEIADRYKVPVSMVQFSYEALINYCESKGKRYKNYKSALRNFVLKDAKSQIERRQQYGSKNGVDARGVV